MRDVFGYVFSVPQQETKTDNSAQDANFKAISSNGYYGYQPLPQKEQQNQSTEFMDVQMSDSGIQFNNFIAPEDRLSGLQAVNVMRGSVNRKRRWREDAPFCNFKKRREEEPFSELTTPNRFINSRQPTHNVPDMHRCLMGHFI